MAWKSAARWRDGTISLALSLVVFLLYRATLLPGIGTADIAEFQRVAPTLGVAHPTGYPLYTLLGWFWSHLPLGGTPAWRMNLLSAATAAFAVGVVYLAARELGQPPLVAVAAALALATSFTFWLWATVAEVYGLAALLQATLILALLRWRNRRLPFWIIGLVLGLGIAHHRTILLMAPALVLFVALGRRPRPAELGGALLALLGGCLLYLYLPLRAPDWSDPWRMLWQYATGRGVAASWLDLARLRAEGAGRLLHLARQYIWPQLLPAGALLALLGAGRVLYRDKPSAALLVAGYGLVFAFCAAYYVNDVDVFLLPAHLLAALLIGEGGMLILRLFPRRAVPAAGTLLLLLPAILLSRNLNTIRKIHARNDDLVIRTIMAQPMPRNALLIVDWNASEGLRYLQAAEGQRPDLQLLVTANPTEHRQYLLDELAKDRPVYLIRPWPDLGLAQLPRGILWQVDDRPPDLEVATSADMRWREGITLVGYTLPAGPFRPAEIVPVTLAWEAQATPRRAYMLFVQLMGPDGTIWGQQDRPPATPTDRWQPGERYVDIYGPVLDPAAPPGRYQVLLGWYDYTSMERLQLAAEDGATDVADYIVLGEIEVVPAP